MARYQVDRDIRQLRKTKTGYYLYYRIAGKKTEMKIASLDLPIGYARSVAYKYLGDIASGRDPMKERKQAKLGETFKDIFESYLIDCRNRGVKRIDDMQKMYDKYIDKPIGSKKIKDINRGDIKRMHDDISVNYKYAANRIVDLVRATFNNAIALSLTEVNPATFVKKNKEEKRERYLSQLELNNLVNELNARAKSTDYPNSIKFIWLCILTGARKGELGKAKWSDLHINKIILKEHKTDKDGKPRVIYLSNQALNIINSIPRDTETILGIKEPARMWKSIRKAAGIEDVRMHDLRHSFGSWARKSLSKLEETGDLLGHADLQSTQRYAHIFEEDSMENAQIVGNYIQKKYMNG